MNIMCIYIYIYIYIICNLRHITQFRRCECPPAARPLQPWIEEPGARGPVLTLSPHSAPLWNRSEAVFGCLRELGREMYVFHRTGRRDRIWQPRLTRRCQAASSPKGQLVWLSKPDIAGAAQTKYEWCWNPCFHQNQPFVGSVIEWLV